MTIAYRARFRERVALILYSCLLRLAAPAYVLRLRWRARREPLYAHAIAERFAVYDDAPSSGWVWLHAVSLGETRAAAALVKALRVERPGMKLLLTTGTATGREAGRDLLQPGDRQCWMPVDTPGAARRFLRHFRPAVGVLMETEIWPNMQAAAERAGVPMVLANARLSAKSLGKGQRMAALMRPAATRLSLALAQTEDDAARLRIAGVPRIEVPGNLKFDMTPNADLLARGADWQRQLGRPVVLAASMREGEEAMLLAAWKTRAATAPAWPDREPAGSIEPPSPTPTATPASGAPPLLVIVPRHPQRFDEVAALVESAGFTLARRSGWTGAASPPANADAADVWLGDSMGEMPLYFALAEVALLGGSFAEFGGQNLIEAAACGCPVVMGPHTYNFAEAAVLSEAAGAALRVADIDEGVRVACALVSPREAPQQRRRREQALAFADLHRGAAARMARRISALVDERH